MRRDSLVQLAALGLMVVALGASALLAVQIAASSGRHQLVYTDRAEEGMTREEALGVAAGAFRGIIVNYLWMRANELKEQGKYHEAVDLAKTITRLQPRFPRVWAFHAWNLAYNISVATQTPDERWQWVNSGIHLLRDEGIPANPNDLLLHKELGWIFLHKIQGMMDDANGHYKRYLAAEWTVILGAPPRRTAETRDTKAYVKAHVDWLGRIADAADTLAEVVERDAEEAAKTKSKPRAAELIERLRTEGGLDLADPRTRMQLLRIIEEQRSVITRSALTAVQGKITNSNDAVIKLMQDAELFPAWNLLVRHVRKRVLVDQYHMEPQRMIRYVEKYGPLDWRHAAAHAVYWSARGVEESLNRLNEGNEKNQDFINTDRITLQAVQELYRSGTVMFDILSPEQYFTMPSLDFIDSYGNILDELMLREVQQFLADKGTDIRDRVWGFYRAGYENFLQDAIAYLYRRGDKERAKQYQIRLASWPGRVQNDVDMERVRNLPLEEFVVEQIKDRVTSPNVALQEIVGSVYGALINGLLAGDPELFRSQFAYARRFHAEFVKEQARKTPAGGEIDRMLSQFSGKFEDVVTNITAALLDALPPADAGAIYRRLPEDLRMMVWNLIDERQQERITKGVADPDFNLWFPEPPGAEELRKQRAQRKAEKTERGKIEAK